MRGDRRRARRPVPANTPDVSDGAQRQPELVSADPGPDAVLEAGEAVEGGCRTIIELLPPKQRAVLILCEVLRCSSGEAAQLLGTTVAAVNSGRQRARATLHGARQVSAVARRPDAAVQPGGCPSGSRARASTQSPHVAQDDHLTADRDEAAGRERVEHPVHRRTARADHRGEVGLGETEVEHDPLGGF
jgi:hypothetical protein